MLQQISVIFCYKRKTMDTHSLCKMHILKLGTEMARLLGHVLLKLKQFPSPTNILWSEAEVQTICKPAESCCLIWQINTFKVKENTWHRLSRQLFMALSCFQVSTATLGICQCHRECVRMCHHLIQATLWRGIYQGSLFLQDWQSAAPWGERLFLDCLPLIVL